MNAITCKSCTAEIIQVKTGSWVDDEGGVWCAFGPIEVERTLHAPLLTPEWRAEIKRLYSSSPKFWTPEELSRLLALTEEQIEEVLESLETTSQRNLRPDHPRRRAIHRSPLRIRETRDLSSQVSLVRHCLHLGIHRRASCQA